MSEAAATSGPSASRGPSGALVALFAVATGALVANLYYAQPMVAAIGADLGLDPDLAGSLTGITQIGYGVGLFLLVSAADLVENRRLVLATLVLTTLGLGGIALSTEALPLFAFCFMVGLCATGAQVLVPFIARLAPDERRGQVVGTVMAGLLTGIMLARPAALFIAGSFGWRAVFWASAVLMLVVGAALWRMMPAWQPGRSRSGSGLVAYLRILGSMPGLLRRLPAVRRRAAYQALMFAAFNLFWTTAPIMLAERFGLSIHQIGLFALAGAGGALVAPVAGRLADRGYSRVQTGVAMVLVVVSYFASGAAVSAGSLIAMAVLAVVLDAAIQANQITGQRIIFSTAPEIRGRVNAIYMTIMFFAGASGAALGTVIYHAGGWAGVVAAGAGLGLAMLAIYATEFRRGRAG